MLRTAFSPRLDGSTDWTFQQTEGLSNQVLERELRDAHTRVLEELHEQYYDAVEFYNLAQYSRGWLDTSPLQGCALEAGKIYVTLDYFSACLPPPDPQHCFCTSQS